MNRIPRIACLTVVLLHAALVAAAEPYAILRPGAYHCEEVTVDTDAAWWGLYIDGDGGRLEPVDIRVERVHDPVVDDDDEATGIRVSVAGAATPEFLIRGLADATARPVHTAYVGRRFLHPGEMQRIGQIGEYLSFVAASGSAEAGEYGPTFEEYTLTLWYRRSGRPEVQEIATLDSFSIDGTPELLWAGDLDGDARPDLIFDLRTHYNMSELALFLSSEAGPEEVVALVARFVTTGC